MKEYFTFTTEEDDFVLLKNEVSRLFRVEMKEHESGWWGVYALGDHSDICDLKLYPNYVEGEGYHEENQKFKYLLSVVEPRSNINIKSLLNNSNCKFELLRHEIL